MAAYTKRRFQRRVFINGLNTNVMKPVLKEIVFIGKAIASIKSKIGTVAKLAMRQPFVLFKGLTFQKLCLPGAFRPG
ncbi:hypothetical protein MZG98_19475, partial [Escherichia coli]|nr:hypothetical protein [Escherichia coli]